MQTQAGAPLSATPPDDDPTPSSPEADATPKEASGAGGHDHRPRWSLFAMVLVAALVILGVDQASKSWVVAHLDPSEPRNLIGSLLRLHLTFNPGAAFNLATGATWVLTIIASAVVVVTIVTARRLGSRAWALALGLLLGGALGNLSDRIFRYPGGGRGHVVDFLELPRWPIFNVADMAVVSAAVLIAILACRGVGIDGKRAVATPGRHEAPRGADADTSDTGTSDTGTSDTDRSDTDTSDTDRSDAGSSNAGDVTDDPPTAIRADPPRRAPDE